MPHIGLFNRVPQVSLIVAVVEILGVSRLHNFAIALNFAVLFCSPKEKILVRRLKGRRGMILIHCRKKGWQSAGHGETGPMAKNDSGWSESTQRQRMGKQRREAGGRGGLLYRPRTTMPSGSEALSPIRHAIPDAVIRRHRRIRSIVYRGRS